MSSKLLVTCHSFRSSHPEVFLEKGALKIWCIFTGEHPCRSVISIKLKSNFIEITLWYGCSPANLLHNCIFSEHLLQRTAASAHWIICNHFHNILRHFDVLLNFSFSTSETMRDYYLYAWYIGVGSRIAERLNT